MKNLKFRVIYVPNMKMYDVLTIDLIDRKVLIERNDPDVGYLKGYASFEDVVLMARTGLKDCNGREVFEGDVIRNFYDIDGDLELEDGAVVFEDFAFIKRVNTPAGHLDIPLKELEVSGATIIIGNIYEEG